MKNTFIITVILIISGITISCHDTSEPNYQYMPNMYESVAYETYSESAAFNSKKGLIGKEGQLPVKGSIKRGFEVYNFEDTPEGYALAKTNSKSPLTTITEKDMERGKTLYGIYCSICHGEAGDGQGKLVKQGKFLGVPNYKARDINEGSIFHVETFGLNAMGSHANQLSKTERWIIASYVMKLKNQ